MAGTGIDDRDQRSSRSATAGSRATPNVNLRNSQPSAKGESVSQRFQMIQTAHRRLQRVGQRQMARLPGRKVKKS